MSFAYIIWKGLNIIALGTMMKPNEHSYMQRGLVGFVLYLQHANLMKIQDDQLGYSRLSIRNKRRAC